MITNDSLYILISMCCGLVRSKYFKREEKTVLILVVVPIKHFFFM